MNAKKRLPAIVGLCFLISTLSLLQGEGLSPGQPAPPIRVEKWLKGKPIECFEPGTVYLVEFWATWCGPCKANIPVLTDIARRYGDQVKVIGVSVWEGDNRKVEPFVASMGERMDYFVAYDKLEPDAPRGYMARHWLEAAGIDGIPAAFIVGSSGRIEYIGHPKNVERVLREVIEGKWDVSGYAALAQEEEQADTAAELKRRQLFYATELGRRVEDVERLLKEGAYDSELLFQQLDAIAAMPGDKAFSAFEFPAVYSHSIRLGLALKSGNWGDFYAAARRCYAASEQRAASGSDREDWIGLGTLAWHIVDPDSTLRVKDYDFALQVARRNIELRRRPNYLDYRILAWAFFNTGDGAAARSAIASARELVDTDVPVFAKGKAYRELESDMERFSETR